jgi:hypothetical protein
MGPPSLKLSRWIDASGRGGASPLRSLGDVMAPACARIWAGFLGLMLRLIRSIKTNRAWLAFRLGAVGHTCSGRNMVLFYLFLINPNPVHSSSTARTLAAS